MRALKKAARHFGLEREVGFRNYQLKASYSSRCRAPRRVAESFSHNNPAEDACGQTGFSTSGLACPVRIRHLFRWFSRGPKRSDGMDRDRWVGLWVEDFDVRLRNRLSSISQNPQNPTRLLRLKNANVATTKVIKLAKVGWLAAYNLKRRTRCPGSFSPNTSLRLRSSKVDMLPSGLRLDSQEA
jgi:hypothetical protein